MTEAGVFSFDGWTLRASTGELTRDGKTQRLTQQPLRILVELLENPGKVVTRERLVELLWPKGVVDFDNGLNVAMRKVRVSLGDDSDTPRYIETLPRLGYRFIGRLESDKVVPISAPAPRAPPEAAKRSASRALLFAVLALATLAIAGGVWFFAAHDLPDSRHEVAVSVGPDEPLVARRTTSVRAYEHYLAGIFHRSRRDTNATELGIENFEAAIREDPEYAAAWAGLADTLMGAGIGHIRPPGPAFARAKAAAERAVALDPGIAEGHTALGHVQMVFERDYAKAEASYAKARAANERYARLWHHLGILRGFQARPDEALSAMRRARELEPMTLLYNANYGLVLYHSRRFDEAIEHAESLLSAQPTLDQARSVLVRSLVSKGETARAMEHLALRMKEPPNLSDAALVYIRAGRRDAAAGEIEKIESLARQGFGVGYELAIVHAALGDPPRACAALQRATRDHSPFLGWMRLDPRMDPLRGQACFKEIDSRIGSGRL
jgi:DNA-binding winged helix-turn-helix (wHTH) protein/tetratricopeptide (TPR) repeat protein